MTGGVASACAVGAVKVCDSACEKSEKNPCLDVFHEMIQSSSLSTLMVVGVVEFLHALTL
jgi:hypothetical protein